MVGMTLLDEARAAGLDVRAEGGRLVVRGPKAAAALAQRLLADKPHVLALLRHEVGARVEAMRRSVQGAGPLPVLTVGDEAEAAAGRCFSCGARLPDGRAYRCWACAHAAWIVALGVRDEDGGAPPRSHSPPVPFVRRGTRGTTHQEGT